MLVVILSILLSCSAYNQIPRFFQGFNFNKNKMKLPSQTRRSISKYSKSIYQRKNVNTLNSTPSSISNNYNIDIENDISYIPLNNNNNNDNNDNNDNSSSITFPEKIAIMSIYFVQGALGLARLAVTFFLKDTFHLGPAESTAITGLTTLPWVIKPIYGFLTDSVPIFGYRRRSYLILAGLLGSLSWLSMSTIVDTTTTATIAILLGSAGVAISDVVADSIVVEKSRPSSSNNNNNNNINNNSSGSCSSEEEEDESLLVSKNQIIYDSSSSSNDIDVSEAGDLQSLCWAAASTGGIITAYFSGSLLEMMEPRTVFMITAIFPLIVSIVSFLIVENRIDHDSSSSSRSGSGSSNDDNTINSVEIPTPTTPTRTPTIPATSNNNTLKTQVFELFNTMSDPRIYLPVLFIFLWRATPDPGSAMFYFSTNELNFKPEFLGKVQLFSSIASLMGVGIYRQFLKDVKIKDIILWTTIISVPLSLTQYMLVTHSNRLLGIPDSAFALTDSVVLAVLGQVAFMPTLVLAASLCPPGVEGTLFASLMSIYNASSTVSQELSGWLTAQLGVTESNFENLPLLIIICSFANLLPLPLISLLDKDGSSNSNSSSSSSSSSSDTTENTETMKKY